MSAENAQQKEVSIASGTAPIQPIMDDPEESFPDAYVQHSGLRASQATPIIVIAVGVLNLNRPSPPNRLTPPFVQPLLDSRVDT